MLETSTKMFKLLHEGTLLAKDLDNAEISDVGYLNDLSRANWIYNGAYNGWMGNKMYKNRTDEFLNGSWINETWL